MQGCHLVDHIGQLESPRWGMAMALKPKGEISKKK